MHVSWCFSDILCISYAFHMHSIAHISPLLVAAVVVMSVIDHHYQYLNWLSLILVKLKNLFVASILFSMFQSSQKYAILAVCQNQKWYDCRLHLLDNLRSSHNAKCWDAWLGNFNRRLHISSRGKMYFCWILMTKLSRFEQYLSHFDVDKSFYIRWNP